MSHLILIEGNISAGKSTLVVELGKLLSYRVFLEPTGTNPWLEKYYAEPKKYGLILQIWMLRQRYFTYLNALKYVISTGNGVILDRSVYSDIVFAQKNYIDGNIDEAGYEYYLDLRAKMVSSLPTPSATIYLDTNPKECHHRIHNVRNRDCESGIPLEYLQGLDKCYATFTKLMEQVHCPVFNLNWDKFGNPIDVQQLLSSKALPKAFDTSRVNFLLSNHEKMIESSKLAPPASVDLSLLFDYDATCPGGISLSQAEELDFFFQETVNDDVTQSTPGTKTPEQSLDNTNPNEVVTKTKSTEIHADASTN